eukprot:m51a1_g12374 putative mckusick-kaufman bardet-biedl syndromes chaperonin (240) ;mRNA; f:606920-607789
MVPSGATTALRALERLAASCYGPRGSSKLVTASDGSPIALTTHSRRLLASVSVSEPLAASLLALATGGDPEAPGGLARLLLASRLLRAGLECSCPPHMFACCLRKAQQRSGAARVELDWSDAAQLVGVVRSVLGAKPCALPGLGRATQLPLLSAMVVRAFLSAVPREPDRGQWSAPAVRVLSCVGSSASYVLKGAVLDWPLPDWVPSATLDARVLLFDIALEPASGAGLQLAWQSSSQR